ncbi:MAG: acetylornithine deacetylase [Nitriliruptorales bacterium]|nr:acetylornithine deacetylase [Nitriliruptorales bacterium]
MSRASDQVLEHLRTLVGFDTTSSRPNRPLIDHVADVLADVAEVAVLDDLEQEGKASLLATIGPEESGGIVLSGHSDCVPVDGQQWNRDPFAMEVVGDRAIGRGTSDMKGFLAVVLAAAPALAAAGLRRPVHIAISHDEELGALSAGMLAKELLPHEPVLAIVGEPTRMRIVAGHKGVRGFRATITGRAGHSSRPAEGANAAIAAARLVTFIDDLAGEVAAMPGDDRFDPPFTTFGVGRIEGGAALNVIPQQAEVLFEYRPVPDDDTDEYEQRIRMHVADVLLPTLQATAPEADIDIFAWPPLPSLRPFEDLDAAAALAAIAPGQPQDGTAAFGTDGGHFAAAGIPTVILGPGDIADAHTANESIDLAELAEAENLLGRVADWATS